MRVADYIKAGLAIHKDYGKVAIVGAKTGAKAMIDIRVVQRGRGWNEATETYKRFKHITGYNPETGDRTLNWGYTNTDQYGQLDTVHINTLKPLT